MENASVGRSMMKVEIDDAYELCRRITKNGANWPTEEDFPKEKWVCTT